MTHHVVMWSGGITSWATARQVIAEHGTDNVTLLFADTLIEDEDLYAFNDQASAKLGIPITRVADGRTPWQVFEDKRWLGNTRIAQCSWELKQLVCGQWLVENADPANTVIYLGIDWSETHRIRAIVMGYAHTLDGCKKIRVGGELISLCASLFDEDGNRLPGPGCANLLPVAWTVDFPLTRPPYRDKRDLIAEAKKSGLATPEMYDQGFPHANCGGACIKGGVGNFTRLYEVYPDRYAAAEQAEEKMRRLLGKDVSILRDRRGGVLKPLPLAELRRRIEHRKFEQPDLLSLLDAEPDDLIDTQDMGGCGCFTDLAA
ncbi:hypothetical protein [Streptomyces sp. SID161]|uniref:hypothetical protein n=1 Tax=Streptomyces sp. SID161 TaxID=2690251 RepID=UPI0013713573|nr:hypothetical protein [Streptomyces sp. SID161]MYW46353.1 hypothetical protein [Streptomyces sp. SID161]